MKVPAIAAIALVSTLSSTALAQAPDERDHAKARLIAETKTLIPGKTTWLALDFEIDDQWHLYWNGVNDSGFAPKLNPAFPEGLKPGEMLWPAPKRHILPGDILDHIYEKHVTLLFPLKVPADAKPGEVTLKASPEWLVCNDVCLPGEASLSLKLTVGTAGDQPQPSSEVSLFQKARERIPVPLLKDKSPLTVAATGDKVSIQALDAAQVAFYPGLEGVTLPNLIKEGERKGDKLVLSFKRAQGESARLRGVIEVKPRDSGPPKLWTVDVDLEGVNKPGPEPSNPESHPRGD